MLDGFNLERFRPRILLIENNRPRGSEIEPRLVSRGCRKFHRRKINDFYVRTEDPADELTFSSLKVPEE